MQDLCCYLSFQKSYCNVLHATQAYIFTIKWHHFFKNVICRGPTKAIPEFVILYCSRHYKIIVSSAIKAHHSVAFHNIFCISALHFASRQALPESTQQCLLSIFRNVHSLRLEFAVSDPSFSDMNDPSVVDYFEISSNLFFAETV